MPEAQAMNEPNYRSTYADLPALFRQYAELKDVPLEEVMEDRASKLIASNFGNGVIGLYQAAREISPTREELFGLPEKLNWRIKRKGRPIFTLYERRRSKRGRTAGQIKEFRRKNKATGKLIKGGEINRRSGARGYHARGWLNANFLHYDGAAKTWKGLSSDVVFRLDGDIFSVSVTNKAIGAAEVIASHGDYVTDVLNLHVRDMMDYVNRKLEERGRNFGRNVAMHY